MVAVAVAPRADALSLGGDGAGRALDQETGAHGKLDADS